MSTLQGMIKTIKTRQVYTIVDIETGGWLSEYDLDVVDTLYGNCRPSRVYCLAKTPLECIVFEDVLETQKILDELSRDKKDRLMVVILQLPT